MATKELIIESKTHGTHTVLIDGEDWDRVAQYTWSLRKDYNTYYAKTQINHPDGGWIFCRRNGRRRKVTTLQMHTFIISCPKGKQVDHINHNGLDNRKENLRICSSMQNTHNTQIRKNNSSGFKGVSWYKRHDKWVAEIASHGTRHFLGYHDTPEEAARAYDAKAKELHGEFAYLNFPDE